MKDLIDSKKGVLSVIGDQRFKRDIACGQGLSVTINRHAQLLIRQNDRKHVLNSVFSRHFRYIGACRTMPSRHMYRTLRETRRAKKIAKSVTRLRLFVALHSRSLKIKVAKF